MYPQSKSPTADCNLFDIQTAKQYMFYWNVSHINEKLRLFKLILRTRCKEKNAEASLSAKGPPSASLSFKTCPLGILGAARKKIFYAISAYTRLLSGFC